MESGLIRILEAQAERHTPAHNGVTTCFRSFGRGEPVVLIHGGHGSWLHWVRNIEALSRQHRVLVPDLPGYGDSDSPEHPSDLQELVDILQHTLNQVVGEATPVSVVAFSFGSIVASHLVVQRPDVRQLILLGPTGHGLMHRRLPMVNWRRSADPQQVDADLTHNLKALMLAGPVDDLALSVHRHSCLHTRFRSREASQGHALVDALDQFRNPVRMIWGEEDPTGEASEVGPALCRGAGNCHWQSIPQAGHWVQYEAADTVNDKILNWLKDEV